MYTKFKLNLITQKTPKNTLLNMAVSIENKFLVNRAHRRIRPSFQGTR